MQHVTVLSVRAPHCLENRLSQPLKQSLLYFLFLSTIFLAKSGLPSFLYAAQKSHPWLHLWQLRPTGMAGARMVKAHPEQVGNWEWALAPQPGPPHNQPGSLSHLTVTQAVQHRPVASPLDQSLVLLFPVKISKPWSIFLGWPWPFYQQSPPTNPKCNNNVTCGVPYTLFYICLPVFEKWNKDE